MQHDSVLLLHVRKKHNLNTLVQTLKELYNGVRHWTAPLHSHMHMD